MEFAIFSGIFAECCGKCIYYLTGQKYNHDNVSIIVLAPLWSLDTKKPPAAAQCTLAKQRAKKQLKTQTNKDSSLKNIYKYI